MSSSLAAYEYEELPPKAFRYLILFAGVDNDPLTCSLHTSPIEEVTYESVSYVWGTDKRDQDITCDGKLLKITPNLHKVLQRVRLPDAPRNLWADSICINQEDLQEKSRQVTIMGQIYQAADRVLICMSSVEEQHGPDVCSLLEDVCEMINVGFAEANAELYRMEREPWHREDPTLWDLFPHPDAEAPVLSDPRWASLNVLVEQDWFRRGWVVREAGLAHEGLVIWGDTEFSWEKLMLTLVWRHKRALTKIPFPAEDRFRSHLEAYEARHQDTICVFYQRTAWQACSLLDYIHFARILRLTDPRDRIYAFLDLAEKSRDQLKVIPNYNDSSLKVYQDFATYYIRTTGDINILHYVLHDEDSLKSRFMTWAPIWDKEGDSATCFISLADNYLALTSRTLEAPKPELVSNTTLRVRGAVFDSVRSISDVLHASTTTPVVLFEVWRNIVQNSTCNTPYPTSYLLEAFFDTIAMSSFYGDVFEWYRDRRAYISFFKRLSKELEESGTYSLDPDEVAELGSSNYHSMVASMTSGKTIMITQRGYLGFGPAVTEEGDLCSIIFGCPAPCLLRSTSCEARYVFLGTGFMLGKNCDDYDTDNVAFNDCLGVESSKDWTEWDVEEQDIYLC